MRPLSTAPQTGIRDRFLHDHRRIEELLQQLVQSFEENDREGVSAAWTLFEAELVTHIDAEERTLIPPFLKENARAGRAILEEHKHLRRRLAELGAGVDLHVVRLPEARAFVDELRAHAAHEDRVLYPWADRHLDEKKRASVLASLLDTVRERVLPRASGAH